jgi:hypothetical protein
MTQSRPSLYQEQVLASRGLKASFDFVIDAIFECRPQLDLEALSVATEAVIYRHPALRVEFRKVDGVWQRVTLDMEQMGDSGIAFSKPRMSLNSAPGLRICLRPTTLESEVLTIQADHFVADGLSVDLILADLARSYSSIINGNSPRGEIPPSDVDLYHKQREYLSFQVLERYAEHWRETLDILPSRILRPTGRTSVAHLELPSDTLEVLTESARSNRCTPFVLAASCYVRALARVERASVVGFRTPFAGRSKIGYLKTVANTANSLPIVLTEAYHCSCRQMRDALLDVFEYETAAERLWRSGLDDRALNTLHSLSFFSVRALSKLDIPDVTMKPILPRVSESLAAPATWLTTTEHGAPTIVTIYDPGAIPDAYVGGLQANMRTTLLEELGYT